MSNHKYSNFSSEDFLADADFLRYVKRPNREDEQFWQAWLAAKPENKEAFLQARLQLGIILSNRSVSFSVETSEHLLVRINQSVDGVQHKRVVRTHRLIWTAGIAASLFFALIGIWFFQSTVNVTTTFGQSKIVLLPDGSEVRLNANSSVSYARAFNWKRSREVVLRGEAFFNVKHINQDAAKVERGELFEVSSTTVKVQVLGTEFNMKIRSGNSSVALIRGKVRVSSMKSGVTYVVKPGELIRFNTAGQLIRDSGQNDRATAWTVGNMVVKQTAVNDIIKEFEELYGYNIILDSPALGAKKIDGTISIKTEESVLFQLSNILNVDIVKDGNTIRLKSRE